MADCAGGTDRAGGTGPGAIAGRASGTGPGAIADRADRADFAGRADRVDFAGSGGAGPETPRHLARPMPPRPNRHARSLAPRGL